MTNKVMIATVLFSAFQIQYPAEGQMVVIDPPFLWIACFWYAIALLGLLALFGSLSRRNRAVIAAGLILLAGGGFAGWKSSMPSRVTIDKRAGTIVFRSNWFGGDYAQPLSELKYATVESGDGSYRLVFVMAEGHRQSIGAFSDQPGQPEAAYAINRFLGLEAKP